MLAKSFCSMTSCVVHFREDQNRSDVALTRSLETRTPQNLGIHPYSSTLMCCHAYAHMHTC